MWQVEYYFSDANLATTEHLMRFISKDPEGFGRFFYLLMLYYDKYSGRLPVFLAVLYSVNAYSILTCDYMTISVCLLFSPTCWMDHFSTNKDGLNDKSKNKSIGWRVESNKRNDLQTSLWDNFWLFWGVICWHGTIHTCMWLVLLFDKKCNFDFSHDWYKFITFCDDITLMLTSLIEGVEALEDILLPGACTYACWVGCRQGACHSRVCNFFYLPFGALCWYLGYSGWKELLDLSNQNADLLTHFFILWTLTFVR